MNQPYVSTHDQDGASVLTAVGEFDIGSVQLVREAILGALETSNKVIVDLSGATFIDSTVLGALVGGARNAAEKGGWLRFVNPQAPVRRVLRITEIDRVIGLYDTVEDAASHSGEPEPV